MKTKLQIIQEADQMFFEASSGLKHSDFIIDHDTDDLINMVNKDKTPTGGSVTNNSTDERYKKVK